MRQVRKDRITSEIYAETVKRTDAHHLLLRHVIDFNNSRNVRNSKKFLKKEKKLSHFIQFDGFHDNFRELFRKSMGRKSRL